MSTMTALTNGYKMHSDAKQEHGINHIHTEAFAGQDLPYDQRNANIHRSASYTFVPSLLHDPAYKSPRPIPITIKGSFSEDDLIAQTDDSADVSPPDSSGWTTPNDEVRTQADSAQDLVAELHKSPKITVSRSVQAAEENMAIKSATNHTLTRSESNQSISAPCNDRLQSSKFAKRLSRKLSYSPSGSSRSSSPKQESAVEPNEHGGAPTPPAPGSVGTSRRKTILGRRESTIEPPEGKISSIGGLLSRRGTVLRRKSMKGPKGPTSVRASMDVTERTPVISSLPKSFSTDKLPTSMQTTRPVPLPKLVSGEKIQSFGALTMPKKRDELWGVFRSLDADYTK